MTDQLKLFSTADPETDEREKLVQTIGRMKAMVSVLKPAPTAFMEICLLLLQVKADHFHYFQDLQENCL